MKKGFFTEQGQEQASLHTGFDFPFNKNGNIYCPRHKVQKTPSLQNLCQFDQRYFDLWEQGLGPLQRHKIVDNRIVPQNNDEVEEVEEVKEEYFMGDPRIPKESRGFGDTFAKFTKATGIKKVVDTAFEAMGKDCGCGGRQEKLNNLFPYGKKPKKTKGFFEE